MNYFILVRVRIINNNSKVIAKMANKSNRYKDIYNKIVRSNNASTFPRHVFLRAQNLNSNAYDRVGNR
jgi:hypothetical protein